jgi:hypothetical protein
VMTYNTVRPTIVEWAVTELARHSSENTHSLSPRPTKTDKGIIRMDDT